MTRPTIIAFTGRKGHGKDTAASILKEQFQEHQLDFASFAFADILKDIAHTSLEITNEDSEYLKRNPRIKIANNLDLRSFYNKLGDAIKSYFGYDAWANKTIQRIKETIDSINPAVIVITDLRYPIEETSLKKFAEDNGYDFYIIKMVNTNHNSVDDSHESEYLIDTINSDLIFECSSVSEIEKNIKEFTHAIHLL
jgi:hypothetical protein